MIMNANETTRYSELLTLNIIKKSLNITVEKEMDIIQTDSCQRDTDTII